MWLKKYLGKNFFDHVQGQKDGVPKKPDPTAALTIARSLGVLPGESHTSEIQKWILQRVMRQRCRQFLYPGDSVEEKFF